MIRAVLVLLLLATLGVASNVVFPIEQVGVAGNRQLSDAFVRETTGLEPGRPWLWAWPYKLDSLAENPWVKEVRLERPAFGVVEVVLQERVPIASLTRDGERYGLSADGVLLPGAPPRTPVLEGRGDLPRLDLITLVQTFPNAYTVRYDPSGYRVVGPNLNVWGTNVRELQDWARLSRMGRSGQSRSVARPSQAAEPAVGSEARVYVYSWGVSTRR